MLRSVAVSAKCIAIANSGFSGGAVRSTTGCFGNGISDMRGTSDTLAVSAFSNLAVSLTPFAAIDIGPLTCRDGLYYSASAIRALPTMTSGIPLVNSRTLFLTQSAAFSLEANASSALSNMLMVISTSGPPSSR